MRTPIIAGNWKMNSTYDEAMDLIEELVDGLEEREEVDAVDIVICPPFLWLFPAAEYLEDTGLLLGAQNCHALDRGAFTGEVSAAMLREVGVRGVVLGHSERRWYDCETDRALQEKVPAALDAGLQPILCVGETEEEREAGDMQRKLRSQIGEGLQAVSDDQLADVVIAYEPIWAIGTGKVASPEQAQEALAFIRALVADRSRQAGEEVRIVYGGSVKADNAADILVQPDVDGALVGGASTDPEGFAEIVAAAE